MPQSDLRLRSKSSRILDRTRVPSRECRAIPRGAPHACSPLCAKCLAVPHIPRKLHGNGGSATHPAHAARKAWQCHTFSARRARIVAVPHIRCTLHEKRGSATHPAHTARKTWQCHTSHVSCGSYPAPCALHERLLLELASCRGLARGLPRREREQVVFRMLAVADG